MADSDFSIKATIVANTEKFIDGIKKGEQSLGSFSNVIDKVLGPKGKLVLSLAAVTTAAVKMGQEMNKSMTEIAKGTGKTGEELYKLRENAHDAMVEGVSRSAEEVGKMVADLNTRFGATGKEVVKLADEFDKFSTVTGIDTSTAIEQVADVMKKWNIETEDSEKLMDQLTVASQESGASVETLLNGLKSGQAVFSQFGMSATDTIAFMADLKQNGIESEQALVGMKTALAKFAEAGIDAQEGFAQVKDAIKNASSETEALNMAVETFGSRNGPEMVKVLRNTANGAEEMKNKLLEAGGAMERTDDAMRTSKDAIEDFIGILQGSFGGLFEGIDALVKNIIDSVTRVFKTLDPLIRPIVNIIRDTLSTIGEMVYTVINSIADQIEQNSAVFDSITEIFQSVYETMHTILGNILEAFKTAFGLIFSIINGKWELAWEYTKRIFWLAVDNLLDILSGFLNLFSSQINVFIEKVINPLVDKWNWVAEKLNLPLADKFEPIKKVDLSKLTGVEKKVEEIDKKIAQLNGNAEKKITGTLGKIEKVTTKTFGKIVRTTENATEKQKTAWEKLKESIEQNANDWSDVYQSAYGAITGTFQDMFTAIGEGLTGESESFEDAGQRAIESISQVLAALGAQLLAIAAARAANYDYASAAIAAAGAAAAFVASGVMAGIAKQMKKNKEETEAQNQALIELSENALKTKYSLEQFEDTLEEIKGNINGTTQSMQLGLISYKNLLAKAKTKVVESYNDMQKAMQNYLETPDKIHVRKDWTQWFWFLGFGFSYWEEQENPAKKAMESIMNTAISVHNDMVKAFNEISNEMRDLVKNTVNNLKVTVESTEQLKSAYELTYHAQEKLNEVTEKWNSLSEERRQADKKLYEDISANRVFEDITQTLTYQMELYQGFIDSILLEQKVNVKTMASDIYNELSKTGTVIGESLMENLVDGASKKDFLKSMRDTIKEYMLKMTVYTSSFTDKLAEVGNKLAHALFGVGEIKNVRKELEDLYAEAEKKAKEVGTIIADVFGDIKEDIVDTIEDIVDEISNTLIDALFEGSQADFLQSMKDYIRRMLIQTLVYTETMKSEIQAIGEAISKGITEGFTETSLHEIRRDLSWTFDQANKTLSKIDEVMNNVFGGGYATGTNNATRGLHLVGEVGPELVKFNGGEQVLNARNTQSALENASGTTINQNVVFNNLQDTSAFAMMSQLRQYNREMAINGII